MRRVRAFEVLVVLGMLLLGWSFSARIGHRSKVIIPSSSKPPHSSAYSISDPHPHDGPPNTNNNNSSSSSSSTTHTSSKSSASSSGSRSASADVAPAAPPSDWKYTWEPFDIDGWPIKYVQNHKSTHNVEVLSEADFLAAKPVRVETFQKVPKSMVLMESKVIKKVEMPKSLQKYQMENWFEPYTSAYVIECPQGFIGDNSIFGPSSKNAKNRYFFSLGRWWNGYPKAYLGSAPNISHIDLDYAVAVGGWGATAFQHFVIDVLPKLALVYKYFNTQEWQKANVSLITNLGRNPAPYWFLEELGLKNRTLPMMGWPKKAKFIYRGKSVIYPGYHPAPILLGKSRIGVYPRGVMLPIQEALGVMKETRRDRVVMIFRKRGKRSLDRQNRIQMTKLVEKKIAEYNQRTGASVQMEEFSFKTREEARSLFSRAVMIMGPHGGGFSNMIFARPRTWVVEFVPLYQFSKKGSAERTSKYVYYGLAQACNHQYWFIEPKDFDFNRGGMKVDLQAVEKIMDKLFSAPFPA